MLPMLRRHVCRPPLPGLALPLLLVFLSSAPACERVDRARAERRQQGVMIVRANADEVDPEVRYEYELMGIPEEEMKEELAQRTLRRLAGRLERMGFRFVSLAVEGDATCMRLAFFRAREMDEARIVITNPGRISYHTPAAPEETVETIKRIEEHFPGRFARRVQREGRNFFVPSADVKDVKILLEEADAVRGLVPNNRRFLFSLPPGPGEALRYRFYLAEAEAVVDSAPLAAAMPVVGLADGTREGWGINIALSNRTAETLSHAIDDSPLGCLLMAMDGTVICEYSHKTRFTFPGFTPEEVDLLSVVLTLEPLPLRVEEVVSFKMARGETWQDYR
jgi:hypothetical protein